MNEHLTSELGSAIVSARKKRKLSQVALAKLTGIAQPDISDLERGKGNPTLDKVTRIANALGATIRITLV